MKEIKIKDNRVGGNKYASAGGRSVPVIGFQGVGEFLEILGFGIAAQDQKCGKTEHENGDQQTRHDFLLASNCGHHAPIDRLCQHGGSG